MNHPSLRRQLFRRVLAAVSVLWLLAGMFIYFEALHEVDEMLDDQLEQIARTLLALDVDAAGAHPPEAARPPESQHLVLALWDADGRLLWRTPGSDLPVSRPLGRAFDTLTSGSGDWRVHEAWNAARTRLLMVAHPLVERAELATDVGVGVLIPLVALVPLLAVMIWLVARQATEPLDRVTGQLAARAPGALSPVSSDGVPAEVAPLLDELNRLLERLGRALEHERRFTGDAAHELRTPLAALRVQAELAATTRDEATRRQALARVAEGTDRVSHLLSQLLVLARLDYQGAALALGEVDLTGVAQAQLIESSGAAIEKSVDLELLQDQPVVMRGRTELLGLLMRNLVDNAVRYTPPGGRVAVSVGQAAQGVELRIADSGPGVPDDLKPMLGTRFWRGAGNLQAGSGLGLSIARRVAELHGATLAFEDNPGGGLVSVLRLPPDGVARASVPAAGGG